MHSVVSVFLDEERPLPTELLSLCLQYAGLIRIGRKSLHFTINLRPVSAGPRLGARFPRRCP